MFALWTCWNTSIFHNGLLVVRSVAVLSWQWFCAWVCNARCHAHPGSDHVRQCFGALTCWREECRAITWHRCYPKWRRRERPSALREGSLRLLGKFCWAGGRERHRNWVPEARFSRLLCLDASGGDYTRPSPCKHHAWGVRSRSYLGETPLANRIHRLLWWVIHR